MRDTIFKTSAEMPVSERPFARAAERTAGMFMMMESPKPEVVRTQLSASDRRVAQGSALVPNPMQEVHNCQPAKRGCHY